MNPFPAFVISLPDNTDRRSHMARTLAAQQIAFEFFDAFDGRGKLPSSLSSFYNDELAQKKLGYKMIGSQVATVVSHLNLYKYIVSESLPHALIMEDDIRFTKSIQPILGGLELLPSNWDVISLCYYRNADTLRHYVLSLRGRQKLSGSFKSAFFTENMHGGAAYLISAKGAEKMIATLEAGFCEPIDHYLGDISRHHLYAIIPKPVETHLRLGLASNVSRERLSISGASQPVGDRLRLILRECGLFPLAKSINLARLEMQKPISHFFYVISRPWLLLCPPKHLCE